MNNEMCFQCGANLTNSHGMTIIYGFGPDGPFCSQDCMRHYMEDTKNAEKWMDWRGEQIKMWRWPEFVPDDVRPRCKVCDGLMTLCGYDDNRSWSCGYCQTRENLAKEGKTVDDVVKVLESAFADYHETGDPKSFDRLKDI